MKEVERERREVGREGGSEWSAEGSDGGRERGWKGARVEGSEGRERGKGASEKREGGRGRGKRVDHHQRSRLCMQLSSVMIAFHMFGFIHI